jgi:SulP family sulfate permease
MTLTELCLAKGVGNMVNALVGGIPGSGTMGATLVTITSGGVSKTASALVGIFSLLVLLIFSGLIAWMPVAALAGILIVVGFRMIDWHSIQLVKRKATRLDFLVSLSVIIVANTWGLIAASVIGVVLAGVLFIREQTRSSVVHRQSFGDQVYSNRVRNQAEREVLARHGKNLCVLELQGSLFFGTAYQLSHDISHEIRRCEFVILDFRRVQALDISAVHILEQLATLTRERKGVLIFSNLSSQLSSGMDVEAYLNQLGMVQNPFDESNPIRIFPVLSEALEWVENRVLQHYPISLPSFKPLELRDMELFEKRKTKTLEDLETKMTALFYPAGSIIFKQGDPGDELYLIRQGTVKNYHAVDRWAIPSSWHL